MLLGPACSKRTRSSGTSSSSATNMASAVCTPWPISLRGMASTTEPSAAILIQPFKATSPSVLSMSSGEPMRERAGITPQPTTSAPVAPSALKIQVRRFMRHRLSSCWQQHGG